MKNRVSPLMVLGALLLALVAWGLYYSIEFYEDTEHSTWSLDALRNPYLAAQQFMQRSGIEVTDVDSLVKLDELDGLGTLFFSDPNQVQTPRQLKQVMDWLKGGGNVIYAASEVEHEDDLLLAAVAVSVAYRDHDDDEAIESRALSETLRDYNEQIEEGRTREEINEALVQKEDPLTGVRFGDEIGELEVDFSTARVLLHDSFDDVDADTEYQPFSWSNSEHGVHMMQFEIGDGLLTLLSDPGIWTSYRIDSQDNAYLLWLLSSHDGNFAILRSVLRDSIWTLIMNNARELVIAASLLLALWMWRSGSRFGRLLSRDLSRQRALGEYFSSVSHYLWQRRRGVHLLTPLRQAVMRRASLALGEFTRADEQGQYELLAERCELEIDAVRQAFTDSEFNEAGFVVTVRLLKHIEQSL